MIQRWMILILPVLLGLYWYAVVKEVGGDVGKDDDEDDVPRVSGAESMFPSKVTSHATLA